MAKSNCQLAVDRKKEKYGEDFYQRIGRIGGAKGSTGGFYQNRELASAAGKIGGMMSRKKGRHGSRKLTDEERRKIKRRKLYKTAYDNLLRVRSEIQKQKAEARAFEYHEY